MKNRIVSIDIFRAVTMLLMIFVNDLWTLHNIPAWLEHTEAHNDGMGLADAVFPAFLFIVGLSIPFAIKARIKSGDTRIRILIHILKRSFALIVMGFFMVNNESISNEFSQLFRTLWEVFMIIAFILIWNTYDHRKFLGIPVLLLQLSGIVILLILAILYRGGPPENLHWMRTSWWGILGLIGWAYMLCAIIYLFAMQKTWIIPLAVLFFYLLNVLEFMPAAPAIPRFLFVVSASNYALVMSGVLATTIFLLSRENKNQNWFPVFLLIPAVILLVFGFGVRPFWGISKILATPSWTAICAGISFVSFALIFLISDICGWVKWSDIIKPAGRSTLTCYLLPGLVYPLLWPAEQLLPVSMLSGITGIIKSLLFAFLIILLTWLFEKIHIKLKI